MLLLSYLNFGNLSPLDMLIAVTVPAQFSLVFILFYLNVVLHGIFYTGFNQKVVTRISYIVLYKTTSLFIRNSFKVCLENSCPQNSHWLVVGLSVIGVDFWLVGWQVVTGFLCLFVQNKPKALFYQHLLTLSMFITLLSKDLVLRFRFRVICT